MNLLGVGPRRRDRCPVAEQRSRQHGDVHDERLRGAGLTINGSSIGDVSSPRVISVVNLLGIQSAEVDVLQQVDASGGALGGAAGAQPQSGLFNSGIGLNGLRVRLLNGAADVIVSHAESKAQLPTGTRCSSSAPYMIGSAVIANELLTYPTGPTIVQVNPATGADSSHGTLSPRQAHSVADVESASLLGGALTATTIESTAAATTTTLTGSCTIVNLRIGGILVNVLANPAPNTVLIDVTRTLQLVINEQLVGSGHVITVNASHLYVLGAGNPSDCRSAPTW
ncbi:MAG: choice-of-anchor P family protein [Jatrophihabitans sp.]|uniref:choice-of-anchor P family protein n=1 Tax=Jatrophihabitans sp. TaxID=1932789 RepID=UPI00391579C2